MWNLIRNELEKMFYRKKILITFIILALMSGLMTYEYVHQNNINAINNKPETRIKNDENSINELQKSKDDARMPEKEKGNLDEQIQSLQIEIANIKSSMSTGTKVDWRKTAEENIKNLKEQKLQANPLSNDGSIESLNTSINTLQYSLDHNVKPEQEFKSTGYGLIQMIISNMGFVFLAIIIGVLVSDIVSGEYTPPTMKVLLTRPVSRGKVLFSKYISAIISSILMVLVVELLFFLIIGIGYGFGNPISPMAVGTKYKYVKDIMNPNNINPVAIVGSTYIIPMWEFTIRVIGLQVLYIAAAASFAFLLSTVLKSSMISMAVNIVVIMVISIVSTMPAIRNYAWLIFTSFGDVVGVIQKSTPAQFWGAKNFSPINAVIVLISWCVICYVVSHVIFRRKDILI